jgi:hypothetical protein
MVPADVVDLQRVLPEETDGLLLGPRRGVAEVNGTISQGGGAERV